MPSLKRSPSRAVALPHGSQLALNRRRDAGKTVSLDQFSENSETENSSAAETADPAPLPDEQIIRLEGIGLVRISLNALDARSRELVKLKFNDELSYKEIAARMNLTASNVGFILHTALKTIAAELAKTGSVHESANALPRTNRRAHHRAAAR